MSKAKAHKAEEAHAERTPDVAAEGAAYSASPHAKDEAMNKRAFFDKEPNPTVLVELGGPGVPASYGPGKATVDKIKTLAGREVAPVFGVAQPQGYAVASLASSASALSRFVEVSAASVGDAVDLAKSVRKELGAEIVEALPVPAATPAIGPAGVEAASTMGPTPDLRRNQGYLADGPVGVGALSAWQYPGGDGQGVTMIDLEGGWRLSHEKLAAARFNLWEGANSPAASWEQHGTAVVGILSAVNDGVGISGISPGARTGLVSVFPRDKPGEQRVANQLLAAGNLLSPGDVLLVELQRPGPRYNYASHDDQKGYVPVSFWPDVRAAIQETVGRGVCVVIVGGNGGEDLDDDIYGGRFDPGQNDCGAIMVGAGAPPSGKCGAPRTRLDFSNHGSCIDVQAWGNEVATCGYGDLWGSANPDANYTNVFLGTSAAAPIVAGVVACLQGRHKAVYGVPLSPYFVRHLLRSFGWLPEVPEQQGAHQTGIGLQPDLRMLFMLLNLM